jgi:UDP-N-acetylmuramyl pentapeptide synthase
LEYGIDHPGDMDYLLSIAQPHMSIFTGLDKVHAAYFETIDQLLAEKVKLLQQTKEIVFVPDGARYLAAYIQQLSIDVLTYGLTEADTGDIGFDTHTLSLEDSEVVASFNLQQEQEQVMQVRTNALGSEQAGYISL